ncbi:MAG: isochorismate synthase MenF [Streptosporangiaceae bacterium]
MRLLSRPETGRLLVRTVAVPDPGSLLERIPQPDVVAWVHHGAGLAGWGEAIRVTLPAGEDRFTAGEKWLRSVFDAADVDDRVRVRGSGLVAFGTFTFDASSDGSVLIVPRVVLGRDGRGQAWLTRVAEPGEPANAGPGWPLPTDSGLIEPTGLRWQDGSLPGPRWEQAVAEAVAVIKAGGLRKVVLARDVYGTADEPIDARVLLRRLAVRYPDCFTFACDGMIGATPELLISRNGQQVSALVLGGTLPRGADQAQDDALGAELLASAKNNEEHTYAVVSIREALQPLCETLEVEPRPALLKFPNLQHLGTRVRGTLAGGGTPKSALGLAATVHPPAAVCGTPTGTALDLIRELEHMDRERYAGPVGWIDAEGNGEWGIAIRCAQLSGRTARLFAGCGIVAGSQPAAELAETLVKLQPMRDALESRG